ncbi:MAG: T9SS type A sorting domain-containing protein [Bacteroidales bacterium]|nr:T9SS type A sorting domain-containing protein [Bacteroidales bacterium]
MRRFLLMLLVVLALPTFAQKSYSYRIDSFMSEDALETLDYQYLTPDGSDMIAIHEVDLLEQPAMEVIDSLRYDANGNITKIDTYQLLNGVWELVCWVEYTYNEMNLRTSRTNYNVYAGEPNLGGIYTYFYDEEGNKTGWELFFVDIVYQKGEYSYNEQGQLAAELVSTNPFTGVFQNDFLIEYYYDDNGNMVEKHIYTWNLEINDWTMQSMEMYEFDEVGNCTKVELVTPSGQVQDRRVYEYDDKVLAEDIYFYPNPENDFPTLPVMHNMLTSYEYWTIDQTSGGLVYVCDYLLLYEVLQNGGGDDDTTSVNSIVTSSRIYPNPAQDYVMIESEKLDYVEVLDIYGREIYATEVRNSVKVDMSNYSNGIYFLRLHSNGATAVQKIVKD